jgi:hypothetical protein
LGPKECALIKNAVFSEANLFGQLECIFKIKTAARHKTSNLQKGCSGPGLHKMPQMSLFSRKMKK